VIITPIPVKLAGGYEFLMQKCTSFPLFVLRPYQRFVADVAGDRICIFGSSTCRVASDELCP
jgi:hypothetical protein